jgi:hypothetical protein
MPTAPPAIRFSDGDVDRARAAAVLIEFERSAAIIVDRVLYRELVKCAVKRTVEQLREKAAALVEQRRQDRQRSGGAQTDPTAEADRERDRQFRELADQAHGVNLDLGQSLLNGLSTVDPSSVDVVIWGRRRRVNDVNRMRVRRSSASLSQVRWRRRGCPAPGYPTVSVPMLCGPRP